MFVSVKKRYKRFCQFYCLTPSIVVFVLLCLVNNCNSVEASDSLGEDEIPETTTLFSSITTVLPTLYNEEEEIIDLPPPDIRLCVVKRGVIFEVLGNTSGDVIIIPEGKYDMNVPQDLPTNVLRFDCNATYPVEWTYEGSGAPFDVISKSFRHIQNFSDPSTYSFSAILDLKYNYERNTGKYTCRRVFKNATRTDSNSAHLELFVPGRSTFLTMRDKETTLNLNSTQFIVPCVTSSLDVINVKLYREEMHQQTITKVKVPLSYNPRVGFTVKVDPSSGLMKYRGKYFCKDTSSKKVSQKFAVSIPKDEYVHIIPNTNYVKIQTGVKQVFICAAKENVTLTFSGDRQPRIVDFDVNPTSSFPFIATFEINPVNISQEHTIINCVSTTSGETLHTWEYSTYEDVSIHKFYFDSQKRYQDARYICCSNSFYRPKLQFTFCRTRTECGMKSLMFDEDQATKEQFLGEYYDRISHLNQTCVMFNPYLKYTLPSGKLRCSVQGVNSGVQKDFTYYFNPYRIYQAYTDDKFDTDKVLVSEAIMKLSKTPSKNTLVGEKIRFLCYYSELFLANGIVWRVLYKNGTSDFLQSSESYLNSNTSFSQIEFRFNETNVRSVQCIAPIRDSATGWRNITGSIFIRESPKIKASIETEAGKVLRDVKINTGKSIVLDKSILDILNNSVEQYGLGQEGSTLRTYFVLECHARYPVDFSYYGEGAPNIEYLPNRKVNGSLLDAEAYQYSARLRFSNVDQDIVGKYSCISATREFGHRNQQENLFANVDVYVPGDNLFVSSENQTYRAWEYRDSVLIPCQVTDPTPNITLYKYQNDTKMFAPVNATVPFDSMHGFSLSRKHVVSLYGLYVCVGDNNRTSGIIQIYLPSEGVRANPYAKEVQIETNATQTFTCEAKENVTITFSDDTEGHRQIDYSFDSASHFPYKAVYNTTIGEFTNLTLVNCTSTKELRTLHTWELYPGAGLFIDKLVFDNKTTEMRCCAPSFRTPTLEWINCTSATECTIKQAACLTQNKCHPSDYILTANNATVNNGCLTFDLKERPSGLLKCVVKGVHKIVAQAMVYFYNPDQDYEVHDGYFLGTKMFDKFDIPHDKVMNLSIASPVKSIVPYQNTTFSCRGSKFFVSSTMRWALESDNGTMHYFEGRDVSTYNEIKSELELEFDTLNWKSIVCLAPIWKEYYGWRNVSIPLVFDNGTTTKPTVDLEQFSRDPFPTTLV